jgi:hypothetical protein
MLTNNTNTTATKPKFDDSPLGTWAWGSSSSSSSSSSKPTKTNHPKTERPIHPNPFRLTENTNINTNTSERNTTPKKGGKKKIIPPSDRRNQNKFWSSTPTTYIHRDIPYLFWSFKSGCFLNTTTFVLDLLTPLPTLPLCWARGCCCSIAESSSKLAVFVELCTSARGERDSSSSRRGGGEAWHFFFVRSLVRWFCANYEEEED